MSHEKYEMPFDEFLEHAEATDGKVVRIANISTIHGNYLNRDVTIGAYDHDTSLAELYWI